LGSGTGAPAGAVRGDLLRPCVAKAAACRPSDRGELPVMEICSPGAAACRAGPCLRRMGPPGSGVVGRLVMVAPAIGRSARAAAALGNAGMISPRMAPAICLADAVFRGLPVLLCDVEAK
jgi:hypothetical protein